MEPDLAEHACDYVLKRVLKLLICRLQIFLVKYEHLRSLQLCEDQSIPGKLEVTPCFASNATRKLNSKPRVFRNSTHISLSFEQSNFC